LAVDASDYFFNDLPRAKDRQTTHSDEYENQFLHRISGRLPGLAGENLLKYFTTSGRG
jgi:hypothetical protein